eukprot:3772394-Alexandrium_andersonii.AAC.1
MINNTGQTPAKYHSLLNCPSLRCPGKSPVGGSCHSDAWARGRGGGNPPNAHGGNEGVARGGVRKQGCVAGMLKA